MFFVRRQLLRTRGVGTSNTWDLAHAIELRGFRLAARGRTHRFRSSTGEERLFQGNDKDVELSSPGSRQMAAQLRVAGIAVEIDPQPDPNGRFASLHDPEGNPIQLWQPAKPAAPR
jgi:hypothetical protein